MQSPEKNDDPIAELKLILEESGSEIAKIFGPALTIFAGSSAVNKDEKEKRAELERLLNVK